jgi:hypothetical protein
MSGNRKNWDEARRNCLGYKRQWQEKLKNERTYEKLDLDDLFGLLDSASRSAHAQVIAIRHLMKIRHWEVSATAHRGGFGNKYGKDEELHFNIFFPGAPPSIQRKHYHVRCISKPMTH